MLLSSRCVEIGKQARQATLWYRALADRPNNNAMDSKQLDASRYDTDKAVHSHYLRNYEPFLQPYVDKDIRLLELGVYRGGSLLMWRDFFERGLIVGLDLNKVELPDAGERVRIYQGQQEDTSRLDEIANENAPEGFDIIIDDCSHVGELTRISFWHLFEHHLKPGGLYVIEDWGTGYWDDFADGVAFQSSGPHLNRPKNFRLNARLTRVQKEIPILKVPVRTVKRFLNRRQFHSHDYGLVGFVKELVDECGRANITDPLHGLAPQRSSKFRQLTVFSGQIFVVKA